MSWSLQSAENNKLYALRCRRVQLGGFSMKITTIGLDIAKYEREA